MINRLEDGVHGMDHTVSGDHVKENDVCAACAGLELDELVSRGGDLLTGRRREAGGAWREVLALHSGAGDNMSQQHLLQFLLVLQQTIEIVHRNLNRTC